MNKYSGYKTYRPVGMPYEQLEPPFYLPNGDSLVAAIPGWLAQVFRRWRDGIEIARTAAELSKLDDDRLRDIGVCREEIRLAARRAVESKRNICKVRV